MKITLLSIVLFLLVGGICFPFSQSVTAQAQGGALKTAVKTTDVPAARFALLIGINDYSDPKITDLNGCENDVRLMREMLGELYGFKPETDIKQLVSSNKKAADKPTKEVILNTFKQQLIENAKHYKEDNKLTADKGATIVFYYSGHGSHLPDQPGSNEEADGEDETIVPMDSDIKGTKDIRDDDLNDLFQKLREYTTNITFIFDSCHSGTVTRGVGSRSIERRSVAANSRGDGEDVPLSGTMDENESYVTISGSLPNEKSQENALVNPRTGKEEIDGYLTYNLVQELRNTPDATYRDLMQRVKAAVVKQNSSQHPQAEGDIERVFLGSKESRGRRAINVKEAAKTENTTTFTIESGRISGALPGGTVAVYSAKARELSGNTDLIGSGTIIEPTDDFTATVKAENFDVPPNAKIVLANPYFGDEKRAVAFDFAESALTKQLAEKLEKNDYVAPENVKGISSQVMNRGVQSKTPSNKWKVGIVRGKYRDFITGNRQATKDISTPKDDEEVYFLTDANGNSLYNFWVRTGDEQAVQKIEEALEKFVRIENLKTLGNAVSAETDQGMELKLVRLSSAKPPSVGSKDCNVVEDTAPPSSTFKPGDYFYLEVTNHTGEKMFPYIYSITTKGEIKLIYPPAGAEDGLPDGGTVKTWGARKCTIYKMTAPYGIETYKLIATTQPFNGSLLESAAIARDAKSITTPLEKLFSRAASGKRDTETLNLSPNSWATASVDIEIKEKPVVKVVP